MGRYPTSPAVDAARPTPASASRRGSSWRPAACPWPPLEYLPIDTGRGFARLPEPSPADIFLDFEGDPFAGESGLEYLTGFHAREAAGEVLLEQVWALGSVEEKAACERFLDFVTARLKEHPGLHIYHFGAYEPATMKRLCARHDTRGDELDRLLRGGRFIDLHVVVREAMRIGIERYGLKELELLHAFSREQDLKEAAVSRRDVELAIEMGDAGSITAELRDRVAKYNAEDCLSTESLRDWLEARRAERVAAGHAIDRPPDQPSAPSEAVSERDLRIETLKAELLAQVPEDPATRSDEHRAVALLASMLSYFRQEEKNAWWEHFRLRELPADEQLEEREMLAGSSSSAVGAVGARADRVRQVTSAGMRNITSSFQPGRADSAHLRKSGDTCSARINVVATGLPAGCANRSTAAWTPTSPR